MGRETAHNQNTHPSSSSWWLLPVHRQQLREVWRWYRLGSWRQRRWQASYRCLPSRAFPREAWDRNARPSSRDPIHQWVKTRRSKRGNSKKVARGPDVGNLLSSHCFELKYRQPAEDRRIWFDIYHQQQYHQPGFARHHHFGWRWTCVRLQCATASHGTDALWSSH